MLIHAKGHPNITAKHRTTIAFTRDKEITIKGDCFVAVDSRFNISPDFMEKLRCSRHIIITISCAGSTDRIIARGHPKITLSDAKDLVIRKSNYVDNKTLAILADKAAIDLSRALIKNLRQGKHVTIRIDPQS